MSYSGALKKESDYWIDIRDFFNAFEEPSFELFGAAARAIFIDDPRLRVLPMTGAMKGIFRIISTSTPSLNHITLNRTDRLSGVTEGVVIPLLQANPARGSQRKDLLVTIVGADLGTAAAIDGSEFDAAFAEFGRVIVHSKPQRYPNTSILNGNRYIVMDTASKIPNRLDIKGESLLLKYKGKRWYCSSCNEEHVGACGYLKKFYELKEKKEKERLSMSIVGDSSLKLVENVGLLADVTCMSGASAGQLVTAVENHPKAAQHVEVVFAAGANDIKTGEAFEEKELCKRIDRSLDRVNQMVIRDINRNFLFLNTTPKTDEVSPLDFVARQYFHKRLEKMSLSADNFELLNPKTLTSQYQEGHPNEAGTKEFINAIGMEYPRVIQDNEFVTTSKPYRGVYSLWLAGCTGCRKHGRFASGGFCSDCLDGIEVSTVSEPAILNEVMKELGELYPNEKKRGREPNTSSDDNGSSKKIIIQ